MPRRKKLPDRVFLGAVAAAALFVGPGAFAQGKLPPYPEALRCAALSHAALQVGKGTPQESQLFDNTIFWSMAAADAGRAAGKTAKVVDGEVERESAAIQPRLRSGDGATTSAVASCAARVTPLDK